MEHHLFSPRGRCLQMIVSRWYDIDRFGKHSYSESGMPWDSSLGGAATQATNCKYQIVTSWISMGFRTWRKQFLKLMQLNTVPEKMQFKRYLVHKILIFQGPCCTTSNLQVRRHSSSKANSRQVCSRSSASTRVGEQKQNEVPVWG